MAKKQERLRVIDSKDLFDPWDLADKSPEEIQMYFAAIAASYEEKIMSRGYTVKLELDCYRYDDGIEFNWVVYRDENDKEFAARLEKEYKAKEKAAKIREAKVEATRKKLMKTEADERAEFERLKAKFEGPLEGTLPKTGKIWR